MSLFCAVYGGWGGPIGYQNICGIVKSLIKTYRVSSQSFVQEAKGAQHVT